MPPLPNPRTVATLLFVAALALALFFALRPSAHGERLRGLPEPVGRWLNQHDDFSNFAAFFALASLGFRLRRFSNQPPPVSAPWFRRQHRRVVFFLLLVLLLEFSQRWIPGRQSDWHDVATGWGGIFAAWVLDGLLSRRSGETEKS